jgi:predicted DNA-binding transcriptional regulator YafY
VDVSFKLSDLHDVTRWVLGCGGDCRVLEPAELRDAVAAEARAMLDGSRFRVA